MATSPVSIDWKNRDAVDACFERVYVWGGPNAITDNGNTVIWERNEKLEPIFLKRVEITDASPNDVVIYYDGDKVILKPKIVAVTVNFDLSKSPHVIFESKAPVSYDVQKKEITAYGPTYPACISTLMVIAGCSIENGCPVEKVVEKSTIYKAYLASYETNHKILQIKQLREYLLNRPGLTITEAEVQTILTEFASYDPKLM